MLYDENEIEILLAFRLTVVTTDSVELRMPSLVQIIVPGYLHCESVQYACDFVRQSAITNMATNHNFEVISDKFQG
jgi:hypothetical protein